MLNLTNVSIKGQLRLLTVVLLGLMIAVGIYGIIQFKQTNGYVQTLYHDRVIALKSLKMVSDVYNVDLVKTVSKVRNKRLSWSEGIALLEAKKADMHAGWDAYMAIQKQGNELNLAKETDILIKQGDANYDRAINLLRAQNEEALATYVATDFYPSIDPIGASIKHKVI